MVLAEFLHEDAGEIFLVGHRVCLHHVVHHYNEGASPEMLAQQYPTVSLALIHKIIAFYLENHSEVDAYVERIHAEIARQAAEPQTSPSFNELRQRLAARQVAKSA